MSVKFDVSSYYKPFFKQEDIQSLGSQVIQAKVPSGNGWMTLIFLVLKAFAMGTLYEMWRRNREDQMTLDKQAYDQGITTQITQGDNAVI